MTICFFFLCYFVVGDVMKKKYWIMLGVFFFLFFFFFSEEKSTVLPEKKQEKRGVFVSYIELSSYLKGKSKKEANQEIKKMVSNIDELGFNMILLQVRTFSDAIYDSSIFPWSSTISGREGVSPGYDVLKIFLNYAHQNQIELYAWINPYRIRGDEDISDISKDNPAFSYLGSDVVDINQGVFYNPAKEEVKDLIVDGVLELVQNYEVDGVLFDDYFYPNLEIDMEDYQKYQQKHPEVSLEEFRRNHVSDLVQRVYQVCHENDTLFAVSPDGNIENNYQKHFADVKKWGSSTGYVDYLMPQIYYGFYNETQAFVSVLEEWEKLASKVELLPVLAFYKVGAVDNFARSGKEEWILNDDIIMREILLTRNLKQYEGFSLFRYDYLFNKDLETATTMNEVKNMKKILK